MYLSPTLINNCSHFLLASMDDHDLPQLGVGGGGYLWKFAFNGAIFFLLRAENNTVTALESLPINFETEI